MIDSSTRRLTLFALIAGIAVSTQFGCRTPHYDNTTTAGRAAPKSQPNVINDKRIVYAKGGKVKIAVTYLNETTVSGNLLKVQATVRNRTSKPIRCLYKFEWIDKDGMVVDSNTSTPIDLILTGAEGKSVSAVATNPRVVDFRFKIMQK